MMTLTVDPKRRAAEDSVAYLRQCFSKFRVSLFRRFGKPISFIAVNKESNCLLSPISKVRERIRCLSPEFNSIQFDLRSRTKSAQLSASSIGARFMFRHHC